MRIRDWSSDVCCSDLPPGRLTCAERQGRPRDGDNRGIAPQERAPRRGNAMQWTADKVQEEVVKLLHPFNPKEIEITPDTDLSADLMMDSVAAMNLVMEIEDRFEIDIPISLLPDANTLQDLVDAVLAQLSKG